MKAELDDIRLLLPKMVPKHGKVSGIKSEENDLVRVIIPDKNTKLMLTISNPAEMLVRSVTQDGKILGLTNYIGKIIYIVDQEKGTLLNETGLIECDTLDEETSKKLFEACNKLNKDPNVFLSEIISKHLDKVEENQKISVEGNENG